MKVFNVPVAQPSTPVAHAFADMYESQTPGVLLSASNGSLRLIHFGTLGHLAGNLNFPFSIEAVPAELVLDAKTADPISAAALANAAGLRFAFLGNNASGASVVSVSEEFAMAYASGSSGSRCTRPNKPLSTAARDWYHYYPPTSLGADPSKCRIDGSSLV